MKPNQPFIFVIVATGFVVFGLILWFNRYAFSELKLGNETFPVRTSRFTGKSETFYGGAWIQQKTASFDKSFTLESSDLKKLQGSATASSNGSVDSLEISLYNGTSYSVTEITIRVTITQADSDKKVTRDYKIRPLRVSAVPSMSNGEFEAVIGHKEKSEEYGWRIIEASGVR